MNARALSPAVIRRFIILMVVATFVMFTAWAVVREYLEAPPGDEPAAPEAVPVAPGAGQ